MRRAEAIGQPVGQRDHQKTAQRGDQPASAGTDLSTISTYDIADDKALAQVEEAAVSADAQAEHHPERLALQVAARIRRGLGKASSMRWWFCCSSRSKTGVSARGDAGTAPHRRSECWRGTECASPSSSDLLVQLQDQQPYQRRQQGAAVRADGDDRRHQPASFGRRVFRQITAPPDSSRTGANPCAKRRDH